MVGLPFLTSHSLHGVKRRTDQHGKLSNRLSFKPSGYVRELSKIAYETRRIFGKRDRREVKENGL